MNNNPPPTTAAIHRDHFAPMQGACHLFSVLEALLKQPGRILWEITNGRTLQAVTALATLAVISLATYGVVVGSLSGGSQLWIAPAKITAGSMLSLLICFPSLYIFLCLGGSAGSLRQVAGMLVASACLTSLLLISFAPVAWVFSQSTDSVSLMGFLHLIFWLVAMWFGLGLLGRFIRETSFGTRKGNLSVWIAIYVVVSLQMMTAVRPIIGTADTLLPAGKQFFLVHWYECLATNAKQGTRVP